MLKQIFYPWKHLLLQTQRLSYVLLCFIHLETPIVCSWASSKVEDIDCFSEWGSFWELLLYMATASSKGPLCLSWKDAQSKPSVTCQGVVGLDVCFSQCWADMSICQACLFMAPSRQLERDEKVYWIWGRKWSGKSMRRLRLLQSSGSPLIPQNTWFPCWPSEVCALQSHSSLFPPPSLFPSLSLTGNHLCSFSLEPIAFYFFVLGNLESFCKSPFWYFKWGSLLSLMFLEFLLEGVRGIEMLLLSLCKLPTLS